MRRHGMVRALLAGAILIAACTKPEDPCSDDNQKAFTAGLVSSWYLYQDLLPPTIDLGAYHGPADLLDALTKPARDAGKDRGWSYITTVAAQQAFFAEGTFVGFGLSVLIRGDRLFVAQVYALSAAESAGFKRGDEIVAIGEAEPLTPVSTLIGGKTLDDANTAVATAFGPATVGLRRLFDVIPLNGTSAARSMIKGTYSLDPVPTWKIINRDADTLPPAGYLPLRTFITTAEARLSAAFADFQANGVTDVIVDLRYNGGGLLTTADLLTNLLGGGLDGKTMFEVGFNLKHQSSNLFDFFAPPAVALDPAHIAFLVTGASASASELVPNALVPYKPLALVGHQTYGKPVGQQAFASSQCGTVVFLVSFRIANSQGNGDYFGGLPNTGFGGCAVPAEDDLTHETGDIAETQTAAALQWLASGTCPTPPAGALSVSRAASRPDAYPEAVQPSEAQRHVRGLF